MRVRPLYDLVAVLVRIGVGAVFVAHGWRKIQVGITATAQEFDRLGVPAPTPAAIYATFVELLGGIGLILGLGLPVVGLLLFLDMAGAFVFVHAGNGLFVADGTNPRNGFELVLVLGLVSLLLAAGGGGRLTIDRRLWGRAGGHDGEGGKAEESGEGGFWAGTEEATGTGSSPAATTPAEDSSPRSRPRPRPKSAAEIIEDPSTEAPDRLVAGRKTRTRKNTGTTGGGGTGTGTGSGSGSGGATGGTTGGGGTGTGTGTGSGTGSGDPAS